MWRFKTQKRKEKEKKIVRLRLRWMFDLCDPNSFGQSSLLHTFMARVWGCVRCEGHLFSDSRLVQGRIAHLVCNQGALKRVISATFSLTQGWFKGEFALPALKTLTEEYQYGYQPLEVEATLAGFRSIQSGVIIATYADPNLHNSLKDKKILYAYDSKNNNVIHPTSTNINGLCVGTPPLSSTQLGKIKTHRLSSLEPIGLTGLQPFFRTCLPKVLVLSLSLFLPHMP